VSKRKENIVSVPFVGLGERFRSNETALLAAVTKIGRNGQFILGETVERFEKGLADFCRSGYVVSVNSGFDALFLSLKALGIGAGDEVITAANSFIASAGAIAAAGATPVFVDVTDDFNIDVELIERSITRKTKAIMPVHLTGLPARMDQINKIAVDHGLFVVEDAAQAIGATWQGKSVGSWGDVGCFSLHPLKNFHIFGDGGFITMQEEASMEQFLLLRNHGLVSRDECQSWGYNSRLDGMQAAMGLVCLDKLSEWNQRVKDIAVQYRDGIKHPVYHQPIDKDAESVFHNYVIRVSDRDKLMSYLAEEGVDTKIHYPIPLHLQPAAKDLGYQEGDFPSTELFVKEMMSLPIYPELSDNQVANVINYINKFYS
jgi:dTDP-4-amino-4,6-dideoxygalactose transaminase